MLYIYNFSKKKITHHYNPLLNSLITKKAFTQINMTSSV